MLEDPHILVVDDHREIRESLAQFLRKNGRRATAVDSAEAARKAIKENRIDLVILDIMMPGEDGLSLCRHIRETNHIPVILLSARGEELDRIIGLEVGADDYVVKPFSVRELVMRVKGLARRAHERRLARGSRDEGKRLRWRGLEIDPSRHRVLVDGTDLALRPLEYKLLAIFVEHPGRVFSRTELLSEVWGISPDTNTRTVDTHIRRLRERLGAYSEAIETVHGFGYRLRDPS